MCLAYLINVRLISGGALIIKSVHVRSSSPLGLCFRTKAINPSPLERFLAINCATTAAATTAHRKRTRANQTF